MDGLDGGPVSRRGLVLRAVGEGVSSLGVGCNVGGTVQVRKYLASARWTGNGDAFSMATNKVRFFCLLLGRVFVGSVEGAWSLLGQKLTFDGEVKDAVDGTSSLVLWFHTEDWDSVGLVSPGEGWGTFSFDTPEGETRMFGSQWEAAVRCPSTPFGYGGQAVVR